MPITATITDHWVEGNKRKTRGTLAFDDSYPTGGEAFTARLFGLSTVEGLQIMPRGGMILEVFYAAKLIVAKVASVGGTTEVPNATDLSTFTAVPWEASGV